MRLLAALLFKAVMNERNDVHARVGRFHRLDAWEAELMRPLLVAAGSRIRRVALTINHLSNGWLFGAVAIAMLVFGGVRGWHFVRITGTALAIAFSIYVFLKRYIARVRPCDADPALDARVRPLDLYSCPSGHTMTAVIFAVALANFAPVAALLAMPVLLLIAWSRISLGHHYPSDVLLGACVGVAVALPLAMWLS